MLSFLFFLLFHICVHRSNWGVTFDKSIMSGKKDTNSDINSNQTRLFGEIPWNERNSSYRSSDADSMNQEVVDLNNQINSRRNDLNVTNNNNNNAPQIIDSVAVINIDTNGKSYDCFFFSLFTLKSTLPANFLHKCGLNSRLNNLDKMAFFRS